MRLEIYELIDMQPGEIINDRYACLPLQDYEAHDDYVVWLKSQNGNVIMRETYARHKIVTANVAISYKGQLFKAVMTSCCLVLLDSRMKWLTGN